MRKLALTPIITSAILLGCNVTESDSPEILLRNRTFATYNVVYITACANSSWGSNKLKTGAVIPPNADQEFPVEPGCWDVRGESTSSQTFVEFNAIEVKSGTYTLTITN